MSRGRAGGALAIVLHTHMPYVEGFGTWPFGEEWLWEAIVGSYLPLLELLDEGAPLTLSLTPVLCDQLEAPDLGSRFRKFIEDTRRDTHEQDAAGLRAGGFADLALEIERSWRDYSWALERLGERGGDLLASLAPHAQWTSSASHAVLPLLATDTGVRLQVQTGVKAHRARFGDHWRGGFWLPECAYAPWIERALEDAGVSATCVELTNRFGLGAPEHLRPLATESGVRLVPIDRSIMSLVWSGGGYPSSGDYRDYHHHTIHHHNPWNNTGDAYDHGAALALTGEHAADFVARVLGRLEEASDPGLVVCALDTELLGHWWYEGIDWLRAVLEECSRQGLDLLPLDEALERFEAVPLPEGSEAGREEIVQQPITWGSAGDLSTWSGPAVADMAFAARAAELRVERGGAQVGRAAIRELLALQASDWPFMVSREISVPYARERFAGHQERLQGALAAGAWASEEALRNLARHADLTALTAP